MNAHRERDIVRARETYEDMIRKGFSSESAALAADDIIISGCAAQRVANRKAAETTAVMSEVLEGLPADLRAIVEGG